VIVDMQDHFLTSRERTIIPNMLKLIRHAMLNSWGIILVEFDGCGRTTEDISIETSGYQHLDVVQKDQPDGGCEVIACLKSHPKWSLNLLVCGVYGPECVAETVAGVLENDSLVEVDVVTDLVYPEYESMFDPDNGDREEREITTLDICIQEESLQHNVSSM
jgi:nicotinamidase-related amidase